MNGAQELYQQNKNKKKGGGGGETNARMFEAFIYIFFCWKCC